MIVAQEDGKLKCEFTRPKVMSVVNRFKPNERLTFDINQEYYVMIAWGEVPRGKCDDLSSSPFLQLAGSDSCMSKIIHIFYI